MRDSNFKSIPNNRASVSITTSLYDRRALDCTSDRPLVNSLNHLTFLTSSSAKVRETLSNDGGIERLIDILYECKKGLVQNDTARSQLVSTNLNNETLTLKDISDSNLLISWKWTLAFQCLVLIGTRGTEKIRKKVVEAGMIPIIATVLDNYLVVHNSANSNSNSSSSGGATNSVELVNGATTATSTDSNTPSVADSDSNTTNIHLNLLNINNEHITPSNDDDIFNMSNLNISHETLFRILKSNNLNLALNADCELTRRYLISYLLRKLRQDEEINVHSSDLLRNNLLMQSNGLNELDLTATTPIAGQSLNGLRSETLHAPRSFNNGILIPKDDDVVWSLQLLAFISKYSYLKSSLQNTYLINGMSFKSNSEILNYNQVPDLYQDDDYCEIENESDNSCDDEAAAAAASAAATASVNDFNGKILLDDENDSEVEPIPYDNSKTESPDLVNRRIMNQNQMARNKTTATNSNGNDAIYERIKKAEMIPNKLTRNVEFIRISNSLNNQIEDEQKKLKNYKIQSRLNQKQMLKEKWNYDTYDFDVSSNDSDYDESLTPLAQINIFPLVEKFTIKLNSTTDMCYWSGVIMRNSCRKDESRGGVRQCAYWSCGRWENYPREFAKCRRCKRTKYCSKDCQMKAWNYHRHWCVQSNSSTGTGGASSANNEDEELAGHGGLLPAGNNLSL